MKQTKDCYSYRIGFLLLLSLLFLLTILDRSNALNLKYNIPATIKIPEKLRLNQHGQPRTCSIISGTLQVITRVALGGSTSPVKQFKILVKADSNRAALQGKLQHVSIKVHNSKSPLLKVDQFDVEGSNLQLGWTPLMLFTALPLMALLRPRLLRILSFYYILTLIQKQIKKRHDDDTMKTKNPASNNIFSSLNDGRLTLKNIIGGAPSQLQYNIFLSNDNLANSILLKLCSKFLLQSLMQNSILQTAANVGDAMNTEMMTQQSITADTTIQSRKLVIPQLKQRGLSNNNKLSKLLSATSFELTEAPTFQDDNIQFASQAVLPDDQARLDFVLRTKIRSGNQLLQFVQPECRFDVTEASSSLPSIVSNLLPKVLWLPVGSGIAFGGSSSSVRGSSGGRHSIQNVQIQEGKCQIQGKLSLFLTPPASGGLVYRG